MESCGDRRFPQEVANRIKISGHTVSGAGRLIEAVMRFTHRRSPTLGKRSGMVVWLGAIILWSTFATCGPAVATWDLAYPNVIRSIFEPGILIDRLDAARSAQSSSGSFMGLAKPVSVDPPYGIATTSIPIEIPPGRFVTPELSVDYSSNGANGVFGVGWRLELGSIERNLAYGVPFNYATTPPIYDDSKGVRLTLRGKNVELYPTAGATTACPTAPWVSPHDDEWLFACRTGNVWTVKDVTGFTYTFGSAVAARAGGNVNAVGTTFGWYLTGLTDRNGNSLQVTYDGSFMYFGYNARAYPISVDYGGGPGYTNIFHIGFTYEDRSDIPHSFRAGFAAPINKRVHSISVWTDGFTTLGSPTRRYLFSYGADPDSNASLLSQVAIEFPASGETPAPPTTFQYTQKTHGFADEVSFTPDVPIGGFPVYIQVTGFYVYPDLGYDFLWFATTHALTDVNGDGLPDWLAGQVPAAPDHNLKVLLNMGDGHFTFQGEWTDLTNAVAKDEERFRFHRLLDIDGDALPDWVHADTCSFSGPEPTCSWLVKLNQAGHLEGDLIHWSGVPRAIKGLFPQPQLRDYEPFAESQLIDLTGDGRPDLLVCDGWAAGTNEVCQFYRNTGTSFADAMSWTVPNLPHAGFVLAPSPLLLFDEAAEPAATGRPLFSDAIFKRIVDVDGDGLPDLVSSSGAHLTGLWNVCRNTGSGFASPVGWTASVDPYYNVDHYEYIPDTIEWGSGSWKLHTLIDMNGDGLPDGFKGGHVAFNTPSGFGATQNWTEGSNSNCPRYNWLPDVVQDDTFDINGDGLADCVHSGGGFFTAELNTGPRSNLLERMDNGVGATWELTYRSSAAFAEWQTCAGGSRNGLACDDGWQCPGGTCSFPCRDCVPPPFGSWVVDRIAATTLAGTIQNVNESEYEFHHGVFDVTHREFRGFRESTERRLGSGRVTVRTFAPPLSSDPYLSAVPLRLLAEEITDTDGLRFARTETDWELVVDAEYRGLVRPTERRMTAYGTGGSSLTRTHSFDSYNAFNLPTQETEGGPSLTDVVTATEYWNGCSDRKKKVTVSASGTALSVQEFTYDAECNPLTEAARLAPAGQTATSGTLVTTKTYEYDTAVDASAAAAGQPTRIRDARNNPTTLWYASTHGVVPDRRRNVYGHQTDRVYSLELGQITSVTDPNGATTTYAYDRLGRLKEVHRPLDAEAWRQHVYAFGSGSTPTRAETRIREPNHSGRFRTRVDFYDGLGRLLETKVENSVDGTPETTVTQAVRFDNAGRVSRRFVPFASTTGLTVFDPPAVSTSQVLYSYDVLDRVTSQAKPDLSVKQTLHNPAGVVEVRDENYFTCGGGPGPVANASCPGKRTVETRDAFGRVTDMALYAGATTLVSRTVNTYDGLNRLLTTVTKDSGGSSGNSTITHQYDSMGRRTQTVDPDSGTWTYGYDNASNMVFENDPKVNQHLEYCYDALDRLTLKTAETNDTFSGDPCVGSANRAYYGYDTATNGKGRFGYAVGPDAIARRQVYAYDVRGRETQVLHSVDLPDLPFRSFIADVTYDEADRLKTIEYPSDNDAAPEVFSFGYNFAGQAVSAFSANNMYVQSATYDRFGRPLDTVYGSGVSEDRTYGSQSQNYRLARIGVLRGLTQLQNFAYGPYDRVGNLLRIDDQTPADQYPPFSGRDHDWAYTYDGVGRLARADWGASVTDLDFGYDFLHNMTSGNLGFPGIAGASTTFTKNSTRPHHIQSTTPPGSSFPLTYEVDGAGSSGDGGLTSRLATVGSDQGKTMQYDPDRRVKRVQASSNTVDSVYDDQGERVARSTNGTWTLYFGPFFEVKGTTMV